MPGHGQHVCLAGCGSGCRLSGVAQQAERSGTAVFLLSPVKRLEFGVGGVMFWLSLKDVPTLSP